MATSRNEAGPKTYPIGFFHIEIAEVRTEKAKLYLFVAIDRTSKFAHVSTRRESHASDRDNFLRSLIGAARYKIDTTPDRQWHSVL